MESSDKATDLGAKNHLPGNIQFDSSLVKQIDQKRVTRGTDYRPRTRHFTFDNQAMYTNRLFLESSPYLLQHAHNPVNWYPWGDEAFGKAIEMDRPVLVSIGYSTCHWCHVMEEESFEDEEIAEYLNRNFICIKVDREERPDVDAVYMAAIQALTGRGGWPLNAFLTPDRKPFWGGTYFPAKDGDRGVAMGFLNILRQIIQMYSLNGDQVKQSAEKLTQAIQTILTPNTGGNLPVIEALERAIKYYRKGFDPLHGGLKGAPKFPSTLPIRFLYRYYRRSGASDLLDMAEQTLLKMAAGGMYDQVGGGFHRYSVDEKWLVPHFEKMLYDNALLVPAYLEGYQVSKNESLRKTAVEILKYVAREMTSDHGAFFSATDADSLNPDGQRDEGYYFTWTIDELVNALGKKRAAVVQAYYGVKPGGNFEGRNILFVPHKIAEVASKLNMPVREVTADIEDAKEILYEIRKQRPHPIRDEKILTAWNGLMISAFAKAGLVLSDERYTEKAIKAAQFILTHLSRDKKLYRSYNDNQAKYLGYLEDYAFFIAALLDLYESTHELHWLEKSIELENTLSALFEDKEKGGFFMTGAEHESLIALEKPTYDGATPTGNSIALMNLLKLGELTGNHEYIQRFQKAIKLFLGSAKSNPTALSTMLSAVDFYLDLPREIIIVTP
ncbi:thioredoxin domain-containing protein, partial [bacterium]|nr:thioredoxin domain-containing protein [bacterium]